MESIGAHGIHEKRGGEGTWEALQQEGWVGVAEFVDCSRVKREEVGWDGVTQLGGVRAGAVEWSSGGYPSILECIPMY
jgi:hypothetical protein